MVGNIPQIVVIGQSRVAVRAPKVAVPGAEQTEQHRDVAFERRDLEVLVHVVGAGQQLLETGDADGHGDQRANGRPQQVMAVDLVLHGGDIFFADAKGDCGFLAVGDDDEMTVELLLGTTLGQIPGACDLGALQNFRGPEGLGGNDKQGGLSVQAAGQFTELATVDIRQVMAACASLDKRRQGFGYRLRAEEGAADADVYHTGDWLFGMAVSQTVVHVTYQLDHLV